MMVSCVGARINNQKQANTYGPQVLQDSNAHDKSERQEGDLREIVPSSAGLDYGFPAFL